MKQIKSWFYTPFSWKLFIISDFCLLKYRNKYKKGNLYENIRYSKKVVLLCIMQKLLSEPNEPHRKHHQHQYYVCNPHDHICFKISFCVYRPPYFISRIIEFISAVLYWGLINKLAWWYCIDFYYWTLIKCN